MTRPIHDLEAVLHRRGALVVNDDFRIHLRRWSRVLRRHVPGHVFVSYESTTGRLVLRVPGIVDVANPGELRVEVCAGATRTCIYLPRVSLRNGGALHGFGIRVGSLLDVRYEVTTMTLRVIQ